MAELIVKGKGRVFGKVDVVYKKLKYKEAIAMGFREMGILSRVDLVEVRSKKYGDLIICKDGKVNKRVKNPLRDG